MRELLKACLGMQIVFFAIALGIKGFKAMMLEMAYCFLIYSAYLTLFKWTLLIYLSVGLWTRSFLGFYTLLTSPLLSDSS
jgi:hypothetical protein